MGMAKASAPGPDQLITATPRALVADLAKRAMSAETAKSADLAEVARTRFKAGSSIEIECYPLMSSPTSTAQSLPPRSQQTLITTAQLNEQILKYLKPEITLAPQAPGLIFNGQTITLHSRAEGKYLNYQWYKNGQAIAGADKKRFVIEDVNGTRTMEIIPLW